MRFPVPILHKQKCCYDITSAIYEIDYSSYKDIHLNRFRVKSYNNTNANQIAQNINPYRMKLPEQSYIYDIKAQKCDYLFFPFYLCVSQKDYNKSSNQIHAKQICYRTNSKINHFYASLNSLSLTRLRFTGLIVKVVPSISSTVSYAYRIICSLFTIYD